MIHGDVSVGGNHLLAAVVEGLFQAGGVAVGIGEAEDAGIELGNGFLATLAGGGGGLDFS